MNASAVMVVGVDSRGQDSQTPPDESIQYTTLHYTDQLHIYHTRTSVNVHVCMHAPIHASIGMRTEMSWILGT